MGTGTALIDLTPIREVLANFTISPNTAPNDEINPDQVFFPSSHRNVLDIKRQLVVGNRGMGKSFWTHALTNINVRKQLADAYSFPGLARTEVVIGFNGSTKISGITPTIEEIQRVSKIEEDPQLIWQAVILRAVKSLSPTVTNLSLIDTLENLKRRPDDYPVELSTADDEAIHRGASILIVFDALDRLSSQGWEPIRKLTKGLLLTVLGLQSFRCIRAKVFMRVDQFADKELFSFPDSSKITNDRVDLTWQAHELYGLLLFELMRHADARSTLERLARSLAADSALPAKGRANTNPEQQGALISKIAGEFMGKDRKRGRVYTWVPLHLSDAANACSPRTFLTAWQTAADHQPATPGLAVDHRGLTEGVRKASRARLTELLEDYPWIEKALEPLRGHFVPISKDELFALWQQAQVSKTIYGATGLAPIGVVGKDDHEGLLKTMANIAVMEERANGKINVPDIFRVEAEILRKGGVAVPRRN